MHMHHLAKLYLPQFSQSHLLFSFSFLSIHFNCNSTMSSATTQTDNQTQADKFSKDVPWYHKEIEEFRPAGRELLENYSHIPPDQIESHVFELVRLTTSPCS